MAAQVRSTTRLDSSRLNFSRLASVSICLCAVAVLPFPQFALLTCGATTEAESPSHDDRENLEEEQVVRPSARRNTKHRDHSLLSKSHDTRIPLRQIAAYAGYLPTIVGHQLANGLRAPLLI